MTLPLAARRSLYGFTILLFMVSAQSVFGSTLTVTSLDDSGPGTLRQAIADAAPADTIDFAVTGTILLTGPRLIIDKDYVVISGPGASSLVISGGGSFTQGGILTVKPGARAYISGVTFDRGFQLVGAPSGCGGNIRNDWVLVLQDSVVTGGGSAGYGGNICNHGTMFLQNSTVAFGSGLRGAGVYSDGTLYVSGSTFRGNSGFTGGALATINGHTTVDGSTFSQNRATSSVASGAAGGGAIYQEYGQLDITNTTIDNNESYSNGAGIYNFGSQVNLTGSTVSNNVAGNFYFVGSGGGVYTKGAVWATNSTFYRNYAWTAGGGIWTNNDLGGSLVLFFNTFFENYTGGPGGAVMSAGIFQPGYVKGNIFARSFSGGNCFANPGVLSGRRNLSDDFSCGVFMTGTGDVNGVDAGLDPAGLKDNGGPTKTIALLGGSPAIDSVPSAGLSFGDYGDCFRFSPFAGDFSTDQRGVARPQGSACDKGAYEATDTTPPVVTVPGSMTVDATSPSGAIVTWEAGASDPDDAAGPVTCNPTSGSFFATGTTSVTCSSTDTHGNTGTASFTVTVLTPQQTLSNLAGMTGAVGFQQATNLLQSALASLARGSLISACNQISAFRNQVRAQTGKSLDASTANSLLTSAASAQAALACR